MPAFGSCGSLLLIKREVHVCSRRTEIEHWSSQNDYSVSKIECPVLFLRGESKLGAVMTDEEIAWLQRNFSNVQCTRIDGVDHLLHLQDGGQTPVLTAMRAFLECVWALPRVAYACLPSFDCVHVVPLNCLIDAKPHNAPERQRPASPPVAAW